MDDFREPDSPAPISDDEYISDSDSNSPPYTPQEIAEIFLDFYTFLTTLHYDARDLKIPPAEGWPTLTPEFCAGFSRSDRAIEVMRRLPYFSATCRAHIKYKSRLIDYSTYTREQFEAGEDIFDLGTEFRNADGDEIDPAHIVRIARGYESYGTEIFLNTHDGEITECLIRADDRDPMDIRDYFDELRDEYKSLRLIPCPGRETICADEVDERDGEPITEDQVRSQDKEWGTDSDIQFIRQMYRQYGWPDAFHRDEAERAVNESMDAIREKRGEWSTMRR
jgi:hypothetical protein